MNEGNTTRDFNAKFSELTEHNQKYIIAIQQALMFAQATTAKVENGLSVEKAAPLEHVS